MFTLTRYSTDNLHDYRQKTNLVMLLSPTIFFLQEFKALLQVRKQSPKKSPSNNTTQTTTKPPPSPRSARQPKRKAHLALPHQPEDSSDDDECQFCHKQSLSQTDLLSLLKIIQLRKTPATASARYDLLCQEEVYLQERLFQLHNVLIFCDSCDGTFHMLCMGKSVRLQTAVLVFHVSNFCD